MNQYIKISFRTSHKDIDLKTAYDVITKVLERNNFDMDSISRESFVVQDEDNAYVIRKREKNRCVRFSVDIA